MTNLTELQAAYDLLPVGVLVVDAEDCIVLANTKAEALFSTTARELVGRHLGELVSRGEPVELEFAPLSSDSPYRTVTLLGSRLQTIIDQMPGMVGYWDRGLRNQFGNPAFVEFFG